MGSVGINGSTLTIDCKVLSMTARLVWRLKTILGDNLKFRDAEWMSMNDAIAKAGRD